MRTYVICGRPLIDLHLLFLTRWRSIFTLQFYLYIVKSHSQPYLRSRFRPSSNLTLDLTSFLSVSFSVFFKLALADSKWILNVRHIMALAIGLVLYFTLYGQKYLLILEKNSILTFVQKIFTWKRFPVFQFIYVDGKLRGNHVFQFKWKAISTSLSTKIQFVGTPDTFLSLKRLCTSFVFTFSQVWDTIFYLKKIKSKVSLI